MAVQELSKNPSARVYTPESVASLLLAFRIHCKLSSAAVRDHLTSGAHMRNPTSALKVALVGVLASSGLAIAGPSAHADPPPLDQQYTLGYVGTGQNPNDNLVLDLLIEVDDANGNPAAEGTQLTLETFSCGAPVGSATHTVMRVPGGTGSGIDLMYSDAQQAKIGKSIDYVLTVTQAGYDPYTFSGSYSGYEVKRPTCEEINNPLVPSFSRKAARRTIAGRTISVTPTTALGADVTYAWKLGNSYGRIVGKTVGTKRSLRLKASWVGRKVGVVIKVIKPGYERQSKTITFAKVRRP